MSAIGVCYFVGLAFIHNMFVRIVSACVCLHGGVCVCVFSSLTRVQSMCRNVNVFFLCCPCRLQSVTVHIHEAFFLEHVKFYQVY